MKKILAIIMVILLPMIAFGQSKEADKYFEKGEELLSEGKFAEALPYFEKSKTLNKEQKVDTSLSSFAIAICCHRVASNSDEIGDYHNAIKYQLRANDIFKNLLGENDTIYASSLNNLAAYYSAIGNYTEAIRLGTQALVICGNVLGEEHPDYAQSLNNLASYNAKLGNYTEAIRLCSQASDICQKVLGEEHPNYAISLNNLAGYNDNIGNYTEAIRLGTQALKIRRKVLGEEHPYYAQSLNNLASMNSAIGNYTEAIRLCTQASEIWKKVLGEEHPDYATSLSNLACYNSEIGNYTEAIRLDSQALEIYKKVFGEEHPNYATSLSNLAYYNDKIGNYTEAIRLDSQALEIRRKVFGEEHPDYATSLNNLANYNSSIGNYTEAIRLGTQALEIRRKVLGEEHPYYAQSLSNLAYYNFKAGNYDESAKRFKQCFERTKTFVLKNFASMTEKERANFWSIDSWFFSDRLPYCAYKHPTPTFATIAYNGQLLSKGLLLNAELEVQKIIAQSGNKDLEKRYYSIRENRIRLDNLYQQPISQRTMNVDSIESLIEQEQKFLIEHIKELGDYTRNLSIEWQDVQKHLSTYDAAIEFFIESDTIYALLLKKDFDAPKLVRLSKATFDAPYSNSDMYKGIWQPLEKYFSNEGNIYFSPSGILHTLAIEHAPINDTMTISDRYNHLYRVSSTRNIALSVAHNADNTAALFGGIEYGAERDTIVKYFADIARGSDSKGWEYLRNTYIEVVSIDTVLNQTGFKTETLTRSAASEENFKRLSGRNHRIIHIATHGYFRIDSTASDNLINTGLVFAGANNIKPYDDIDDGLLTAQEISRLDLHNTDLVVLSACETALGTVTSEGVFGIQRGFKKAGANTIVMSVKKVYDAATKEFMVEFYKNMMRKGIVKHDAFVSAVHAMRKKYPDDPDKWATFIMLDGN